MKEPGKSLGFFISQGDGWLRKDGIFVSRVNLGSSVDTNGLLSVGDEIIKVNNVDVTQMLLDDVVLVMKFVKRMILMVKVLTAFGFSSDLSLHKSLLSRQLPSLPHPREEEQGASDDNFSRVKWWRSKFRTSRGSSRANSMGMMKSTSFGESFMTKLDTGLARVEDVSAGEGRVVTNPYEVSFDDAKKHSEDPVKPMVGASGGDYAAEINPYAKVSLRTDSPGNWGRRAVAEAHGQSEVGDREARETGGATGPAQIIPYAMVSLRTGGGEGGRVASIPDDEDAEISPYARVSLLLGGGGHQSAAPHGEASDRENRGTIGVPDEDISPYAKVSLKADGSGEGPRIVVEVHPQHEREGWRPYEETELGTTRMPGGDSKKTGLSVPRVTIDPYEVVSFSDASKSPNNPYEAVEKGSHMNMGSLLSLLRTKQILSSSPAVKKRSNILDEIVVSPDHVYAQIDRTRKYDSSGEEEEEEEEEEEQNEARQQKGRSLSNTAPPPAPTSPLPRDDSLSVLPDMLSALLDESIGLETTEEAKSHQKTSDDPEVLTPLDATPEVGNESTTDDMLEEGPPPPLPPPYVPEDGPPDSSDEDGSEPESEGGTQAGSLGAEPLVETELPAIRAEVGTTLLQQGDSSDEPVTVPEKAVGADGASSVEKLGVDSSPLRVSTPIQRPLKQDGYSPTPDFDEKEDSDHSFLSDSYSSDESKSLEEVSEEKPSLTHRNMSQDSFSDLPPPPPPPTGPPEDEISSSSDKEDDLTFTLLNTSSQDKGEEETALSSEQQSLSGMITLQIHGLDISSRRSRTFWSSHEVQKVTFTAAVDGKVKMMAKVPLGASKESDDEVENAEYEFLLFNSTRIVFSVNPMCLPTVSRVTTLSEVFPSSKEGVQHVYIDFETYGQLRLSLEHHSMRSAVRRMGGDVGCTNPTFSDLVSLNPNRDSGCPLVLEECIDVVERYGLKTPHLYERCTPTRYKHRALEACMKNLSSHSVKSVLIRCSVHAFTGLIIDFFRDLPEPFFTNEISSSFTQAASVGGTPEVLEGFLLCLPDDVGTTLNMLLHHFRLLIEHGEKNGMTAKSIAKLFGPLLLTPSLSPDLNTSTTSLDYAEDYDSQANVIELLLSRKNTS